MSQRSVITESELRKLITESVTANRPVVIDWVNRTISVLGPVEVIKLSNGSLVEHQEIIFELSR